MIKKIPNLSKKDISRFVSRITPIEDLCLIWSGYCFKKRGGYGRFLIKERTYFAHRIAFFIHYRIDPKDKLVCHTCDNPRCVNPLHLFLGTQADNMRDMDKKGRRKYGHPDVKGEKHGGAKLKNKDISEIRRLIFKCKVPQRQVAFKFKVSPATIHNIIKRKSWVHI